MEEFVNATWVAEFLSVSTKWVYEKAREGKLPSYRIGGAVKFKSSEIRQWMRDHRTGE